MCNNNMTHLMVMAHALPDRASTMIVPVFTDLSLSAQATRLRAPRTYWLESV